MAFVDEQQHHGSDGADERPTPHRHLRTRSFVRSQHVRSFSTRRARTTPAPPRQEVRPHSGMGGSSWAATRRGGGGGGQVGGMGGGGGDGGGGGTGGDGGGGCGDGDEGVDARATIRSAIASASTMRMRNAPPEIFTCEGRARPHPRRGTAHRVTDSHTRRPLTHGF